MICILFIGGALVIGVLAGFFIGKYVEVKKQTIG
jgi:uncharacterized protein YneF (UPF0154 family)